MEQKEFILELLARVTTLEKELSAANKKINNLYDKNDRLRSNLAEYKRNDFLNRHGGTPPLSEDSEDS